MARYNHFSAQKYCQIWFGEVKIGKKFRMDKGNKKRYRRDIVMVKTGDLSYEEFKSKKKYTLFSSKIRVSEYNKTVIQMTESQ